MAKRTVGGAGVTWSASEARGMLEEWEKSGKSCAAFARSVGVVPQRLFWWRKRLAGATSGPMPAFVPVVTTPDAGPTSDIALVVTTKGGTRIEVRDVDASTAAWVVSVLERTGA
jgi:hypothetical protein